MHAHHNGHQNYFGKVADFLSVVNSDDLILDFLLSPSLTCGIEIDNGYHKELGSKQNNNNSKTNHFLYK
jgi:hypothetical protein